MAIEKFLLVAVIMFDLILERKSMCFILEYILLPKRIVDNNVTLIQHLCAYECTLYSNRRGGNA